jgi:hypothetical protein
MLVHFVTDEPTTIPAIRAMLEPRYHVVPQLLGGSDTEISSNGVLMVDADLRKVVRVEQIKLVLRDLNCLSERLFVVEKRFHHMRRRLLSERPPWFLVQEKSYSNWRRSKSRRRQH